MASGTSSELFHREPTPPDTCRQSLKCCPRSTYSAGIPKSSGMCVGILCSASFGWDGWLADPVLQWEDELGDCGSTAVMSGKSFQKQ